jgi:hypothetical protein
MVRTILQRVQKSLPWTLTFKVVLVLVVAVSGASITITQSKYQTELGGTLNFDNHVVLIDRGFSVFGVSVNATGGCPSLNVTFTNNPTIANTAIISGDYVYDAQIVTTSLTPTLSCFTARLTITPNGGPASVYSVTVASGSTVSSGETIDCQFDIGPSLPTPPFTFLATVG